MNTQNKAYATILSAIQKMKSSSSFDKDDQSNYWRAETDKSGNGYAIIRFLPGPDDESVPFVKKYDHGFRGPNGRWYIENCPTTIGGNCPVCEANGVLWNSGVESNKSVVRQRKRRVSYVANVLVISDPKNPDNEGKVFLFKFGKSIFDIVVNAISPPPEFPDEEPMNPFDVESGANFKLKIRRVDGYANFSKSEFEKPSRLDNWKDLASKLHPLDDLVAPSQFKDYEILKTRFNTIWGDVQNSTTIVDELASLVQPEESSNQQHERPNQNKKQESSVTDDDMDYFRSLVDED